MFRSAGNPIVLGLGTAAIVTLGVTCPAWALNRSVPGALSPAEASPADSADRVKIDFSVQEPVPTGKRFEVKVTVTPREPNGQTGSPPPAGPASPTPAPQDPLAGLRLIVQGPDVPALEVSRCTKAEPCELSSLEDDPEDDLEDAETASDTESVFLTLPASYSAKDLTLLAEVLSADDELVGSRKSTVQVERGTASPRPSPTKPTKTPTKDPGRLESPSPSPAGSSNSTGGSAGGPGGPSGPPGGVAHTPPAPHGSAAALPPARLPQANAPLPSVAPGAAALVAPQTTLRSGSDPVAHRQEFDRLARTQAAWLSALLVAFFLLVAQLRLNRGRAAAPPPARRRYKGAHRRH